MSRTKDSDPSSLAILKTLHFCADEWEAVERAAQAPLTEGTGPKVRRSQHRAEDRIQRSLEATRLRPARDGGTCLHGDHCEAETVDLDRLRVPRAHHGSRSELLLPRRVPKVGPRSCAAAWGEARTALCALWTASALSS